MPLIIPYMLKFSLSLALLYIFYQLVLRKLTFYNWNRWCLLGYTLLSFFIPFINISYFLENSNASDITVIYRFPAIEELADFSKAGTNPVNWWGFILSLTWIGVGVLLGRLIVSLISYYRMVRKSTPISKNGVSIYQVNKPLIPFSFGNSIFLNPRQHTDEELKEIIRHEFVHVRQGHTLDIIWAEILCIINWYNPFAWLLRKAIRQNLEFIADHKVLENGVDKKEYQYLLLKVIGNNQFSIASQFNFSSLKKRIAMMNKIRSAKLHLARFLFLLPLIAVMLLAFRSSIGNSLNEGQVYKMPLQQKISGQPDSLIPVNSKGFYVSIGDSKGNCTVVVRNEKGKPVEKIDLVKWNASPAYSSKYGNIVQAHDPEDCPLKKDCEEVESPEAKAVREAYATTEVIAPFMPNPASLLFINNQLVITGNEDIVIAITNKTTEEELKKLITQMKAKGVELKITNKNYNDGILTEISGELISNGNRSNFSAVDFKSVRLAVTTRDGKTYFKILIDDPNFC